MQTGRQRHTDRPGRQRQTDRQTDVITATPRKLAVTYTQTFQCHMALITSVLVFVRRSLLPTKSSVSRDRLVVRTLRCGRSNPGSNPGHGMDKNFLVSFLPKIKFKTLRRPGIEPGSTAWKAAMLTIIPPTL